MAVFAEWALSRRNLVLGPRGRLCGNSNFTHLANALSHQALFTLEMQPPLAPLGALPQLSALNRGLPLLGGGGVLPPVAGAAGGPAAALPAFGGSLAPLRPSVPLGALPAPGIASHMQQPPVHIDASALHSSAAAPAPASAPSAAGIELAQPSQTLPLVSRPPQLATQLSTNETAYATSSLAASIETPAAASVQANMPFAPPLSPESSAYAARQGTSSHSCPVASCTQRSELNWHRIFSPTTVTAIIFFHLCVLSSISKFF